MRSVMAFVALVTLLGLVALAFVPWLQSGVPFEREGRQITLTGRWLAILTGATFLTNLAAGALATWIDRSGDAAKSLMGFELLARPLKFISKFVFDPREIPNGVDLASIEFREAWTYLLIPPWYILAYGVLSVAGLYLGRKIVLSKFEPNKAFETTQDS